MNKSQKLKKVLGKDLQENVVLREYTTMKVGGMADYFYLARKIDNLVKAVVAAKEAEIPFVILGGASNVIISDHGFSGLVIVNRSSNLVFLKEKAQAIVDSGVSLIRLIMEAANRDLGGLEPLYGIPGTVGGAVYGNVGAQGIEIGQLIKSITLLSPTGKIVRYQSDWLQAKYRSTKIKKMKKQGKEIPIILSVRLQLSHNKKEEILRKLQYYKKLREEKQPYDKPSAGSIFKNVGTEKEKTAGFILEQVGAKKLRIGGAEVSRKHANFVINRDKAKAEDVKNLIKEMKSLAHDKYGVELEEEIEYI